MNGVAVVRENVFLKMISIRFYCWHR